MNSQNNQSVGRDGGGDIGSRILSAETMNERNLRKTITDRLQEIITLKSASNQEFSILKFEGDMVTTFFDNITKLSDEFT